MADKDKNGIDDRLEYQGSAFNPNRPGERRSIPGKVIDTPKPPVPKAKPYTPIAGRQSTAPAPSDTYAASGLPSATSQGGGDFMGGLRGVLQGLLLRPQLKPGQGPAKLLSKVGADKGTPAPQDPGMSFADYLAQAMSLFGSSSGGGSVNYDPQRGTARQNAAENDARLEAMYRQLRGSIDADAPVIQGNYQQAIDNTAQNSQSAQAQTQAASDNALARQDQVLASLGIQQAQGNQIQQGTDLSTQTAQTIGDQATKGQAAGDRLVSNQATALSHNTNIGNAAGLEGNLQRASNQARLQALLADIDMKEQQDNASLASSSSGNLSSALGLAKDLYGYDIDERRYQDELSMSAAQLAQKGQSLPDLGAILQAMGLDQTGFQEQSKSDPAGIAKMLDVLRKLQITQ